MTINSMNHWNPLPDNLKRKLLLAFAALWILCSTILQAQEKELLLEDGFEMLENRKYQQAKDHFQAFLVDHPDDKTARICYGRAIGLGGAHQKALSHFETMQHDYPGDVEIALNVGEAYLWNQKYQQALQVYEQLVQVDAENFAANLGLSNSLSNLKRYPEAYQAIHKTLQIQPGSESALFSMKHIILGYASEYAYKKFQYDSAFAYIEEIFTNFPDDHEASLLKASILNVMGHYQAAATIYAGLKKDRIYALIGQAISAHLGKDDRTALRFATEAYQQAIELNYKPYLKSAATTYVSALLWNGKFDEAELTLMKSKQSLDNDPQLLLVESQLYVYQGKYRQALPLINRFLELEPQSAAGNLAWADAMHALGLDQQSYHRAMSFLQSSPEHPEVLRLVENLNARHTPYISPSFTVQGDSDKSRTHSWNLFSRVSLAPQWSADIRYRRDISYKQGEDDEVVSQYVSLSSQLQWSPILKLTGSLGMVKVKLPEIPDNTTVLGNLTADLRLNSAQRISIGYKRELQNFNKDLLEQNIVMDHVFVRNSMYWAKSKMGWYTELFQTWQNDGNQRQLAFTSIYHQVSSTPNLKVGLNYLYLGFEKQVRELYFSPRALQTVETFLDVSHGNLKELPWVLNFNAAFGYQYNEDIQPVFRTQASVTRKLGTRVKLKVSGLYSSQSAQVSNGFSYHNFQVELSYKLARKPWFYRRFK